MHQLKDNSARARIAILFLWLSLVVALLAIVNECLNFSVYSKMSDISFLLSSGGLQFYGIRVLVMGILAILVFIGTAIVFIMWMYRAYENLVTLKVPDATHPPHQAIWSWMVPIFNLFRPAQMIGDIYRGTYKLHQKVSTGAGTSIKSSDIVSWWWAAYLISSFLSRISVSISKNTMGSSALFKAAVINIICLCIWVVCALLIIAIIKKVADWEEQSLHLFRTHTDHATLERKATSHNVNPDSSALYEEQPFGATPFD